ncbi:reverse transcriptase [Plakobranchus ocellatus]|uniref:Reverse transcriptase n=1 Tax=Plakobranchus ocellatus TaxID=259542 RepID=A0AAV4BAN3_9GAST|nr:reverse transcriptase [Plakobranchus ocellatus]
MAICDANGLPVQPKAKELVFTSEGGMRSWCGSASIMDTQRKRLLDGCDDWEISANIPEWSRHPKSIQDTRMRPGIVLHSSVTRQIFMIELIVTYERRMEESNTCGKRLALSCQRRTKAPKIAPDGSGVERMSSCFMSN